MSGLRLAVLLAGCVILTSAEEVPRSLLSFAFGTVWPGAVLRHRFTFTNEGTSAWTVVRQSSTCACSVTEDLPRTVPAAGQLVVPIVFAVGKEAGEERSGTITIRVVDGGGTARDLLCSFNARVEPSLVLPGKGRLTHPPIPADGPAVRFQEVIKRGAHPAAWNRLTARVSGGGELLTAEVVSSAAQPNVWTLACTVTPKRIAGVVLARIELTCWNDSTPLPMTEQLTLPLTIEGPVMAEPSSLLIGAVPVDDVRTTTFAVRRRSGDLPVTITALAPTDPLRYAARLDEEGRIEVRFTATGKAGQAPGWIDVTTAEGVLRVPCFAAIATGEAVPR